jgi:monovalent cation:H+ antiporter-2, CPA2 family
MANGKVLVKYHNYFHPSLWYDYLDYSHEQVIYREKMMHLTTFLQDLAFIMIVAGIVTIIFRRLKQPVVLGYIIAGIILGPNTPPFSFIQDGTTVKTLAEVGIIFLMFSLGLEFSIRKLLRIGIAALVAALAEIISMILIGYEIGQFFGWKSIDSLFLGAMLAISSTTIIVKALNELGMKNERFAQIIFGVLIIEDILAIGILALLSSIATQGSISTLNVLGILGNLLVFLVSSLIIGILIIPKLLSYVSRSHSKEMLLITVLGLCFGFCLLAIQLGYSVALGAFLIGAIIAESQEINLIEKLIRPITDMFSAIFFVSIGLLVDPKVIITYLVPITIITVAVVIGKITVCSLGTFLAGRDGRTAMRVGMGLAQIGEFSFIIASLGISLNVMDPFLYPVIVAVSVITTLLTPYLIKMANPLALSLIKHMPPRLLQFIKLYTRSLQNIRPHTDSQIILTRLIKKSFLQIFINLMLIIGIFVGGSFFAHMKHDLPLATNPEIQKTLIWGISLIISLPFLIATYRKLKGLSMVAAEIAIRSNKTKKYTIRMQYVISKILPVVCMLGIILVLIALSASILPPLWLLIVVLVIAIIMTMILWNWFIKLHSKFQIALIEQFEKKDSMK